VPGFARHATAAHVTLTCQTVAQYVGRAFFYRIAVDGCWPVDAQGLYRDLFLDKTSALILAPLMGSLVDASIRGARVDSYDAALARQHASR
jgi:hypothetical protein